MVVSFYELPDVFSVPWGRLKFATQSKNMYISLDGAAMDVWCSYKQHKEHSQNSVTVDYVARGVNAPETKSFFGRWFVSNFVVGFTECAFDNIFVWLCVDCFKTGGAIGQTEKGR